MAGDPHDWLYAADLLFAKVTDRDPSAPPQTVAETIAAIDAALEAYGHVFPGDRRLMERVAVLCVWRGMTPQALASQTGVSVQRMTGSGGGVALLQAELLATALMVPAEVLIAPPIPHVEQSRTRRRGLRRGDAVASLDPKAAHELYGAIYPAEVRLGQRLREMRSMRGWNQHDLERASGIPVALIMRIEGDEPLTWPVESTVPALSKALRILYLVFLRSPEVLLWAARARVRTTRGDRVQAAREEFNPLFPETMPLEAIFALLLQTASPVDESWRSALDDLAAKVARTPVAAREALRESWGTEATEWARCLHVPMDWLRERMMVAPVGPDAEAPPPSANELG